MKNATDNAVNNAPKRKLGSKSIFAMTALAGLMASAVNAIEPDDLVEAYLENTGGKSAWTSLEGMRMVGEADQGGMKFPVEIVQLKDGRQYFKFTFQGKELKQGVYDGESVWSTNFMTQKAEKADQETTENLKLDINDFPNDFVNYKEKGYTMEVVGEESIEGTEAYKVKLVKEPVTVDGQKVESVSYYFFDKDSMVPLVMQQEITSGQAKGAIAEVKFSDYDEVDGLYFPMSVSQGVKDSPQAFVITVESIELNPEVDAGAFAMPEGQ